MNLFSDKRNIIRIFSPIGIEAVVRCTGDDVASPGRRISSDVLSINNHRDRSSLPGVGG